MQLPNFNDCMEYSKIVSVTGLPGLYELISSKNDGAIVRSLDDKSTRFVSSRIHNFSHLESIEVYTDGDNVNLVEVFEAMQKNGGAAPDEKDAAGIKAYFEKVFPRIDFERVYNSDMKKMIKWYGILKAHDIEIKLSEPVEEEQPVEEPVKEEPPKIKEVKAEKPKKAAKAEETKEETKAKPKKEEKETPAKKTPKAVKEIKEEPKAKPKNEKEEKKAPPKKATKKK